jgi:hypothetical protein
VRVALVGSTLKVLGGRGVVFAPKARGACVVVAIGHEARVEREVVEVRAEVGREWRFAGVHFRNLFFECSPKKTRRTGKRKGEKNQKENPPKAPQAFFFGWKKRKYGLR